MQPSSSSDDSSSSDEEDDEKANHIEVGSEETESRNDEQESREEEEDDDDNEEYPKQENVPIGASTPDDTKIETLLDQDDLYLDIETCDDDVRIIGVVGKKEVGASKTAPLERRGKSPPSSQKASTKRTSHERSP